MIMRRLLLTITIIVITALLLVSVYFDSSFMYNISPRFAAYINTKDNSSNVYNPTQEKASKLVTSTTNKTIKYVSSTTTTTTTTTTTIIPTTQDIKYATINPAYEKGKKWFAKSITRAEKKMFRSLMKVFHETLFPNVTYFLYGGTLLGSYRNHGMIPWDDDLDLFVDKTQKPLVEKGLEALGSEYALYKKITYSWKFTFSNSTKTYLGWNWPFLDIFFFESNKTHFWDLHSGLKHHKYNKSEMFPLVKRPFMGMLLPAPKNTRKALNYLFDIDICHSPTYDHKKEGGINSKKTAKMPCDWLKKDYSFVRRERIFNTTYEILIDNEHVSVFDTLRERFSFI